MTLVVIAVLASASAILAVIVTLQRSAILKMAEQICYLDKRHEILNREYSDMMEWHYRRDMERNAPRTAGIGGEDAA